MTPLPLTRPRMPLRAWPHDPSVAYLSFTRRSTRVTVADVVAASRRAASHGFRGVITSAVGDRDVAALVAAGFTERDRLAILARPLDSPVESDPRFASRPLSRIGRRDIEEVLRVDTEAFAPQWALDVAGYREALRATPRTRARAIFLDDRPVAFGVCGMSHRTGYLQRLAVDPAHQRQGLGHQLVGDSARWLRRHRAHTMYVNTEVNNAPALALYESVGFVRQAELLRVFERDL